MNLCTKQKETHIENKFMVTMYKTERDSHRKQIYGYQRGRGEEGQIRNRYKLLYIK